MSAAQFPFDKTSNGICQHEATPFQPRCCCRRKRRHRHRRQRHRPRPRLRPPAPLCVPLSLPVIPSRSLAGLAYVLTAESSVSAHTALRTPTVRHLPPGFPPSAVSPRSANATRAPLQSLTCQSARSVHHAITLPRLAPSSCAAVFRAFSASPTSFGSKSTDESDDGITFLSSGGRNAKGRNLTANMPCSNGSPRRRQSLVRDAAKVSVGKSISLWMDVAFV